MSRERDEQVQFAIEHRLPITVREYPNKRGYGMADINGWTIGWQMPVSAMLAIATMCGLPVRFRPYDPGL